MPAFGPDPVPSPEDGSAYVTVNIPEGSGLAWKAGDVITVETASGTENYTLIPGSSALKGVFRGKPLSGSTFNILLPGPQTSFEAMRATDFSRQTQKADADDSHIRPMIALKGVNTLSGATLSKEWASEKGGEFFRTRVMTVAIQVPSAMKTLSSVTVTSPLKSFGSYTVELPDLDMTALGHRVKAFIQFSWNTPVMSPGNMFSFILTGGGLTATRDVKVDESTAVPSPSLVLDNKDWEGEGIVVSGPGTAAAPYKIASADDLLACTRFPDAIAAGNYDIDIHSPDGSGTSHHYFDQGQWYTIPYRSLLPREGGDNLLVAGRCISATHEAQASIRIMPIVTALGQAAGTAAALARKAGVLPPDVDPNELRAALRRDGAFVG